MAPQLLLAHMLLRATAFKFALKLDIVVKCLHHDED